MTSTACFPRRPFPFINSARMYAEFFVGRGGGGGGGGGMGRGEFIGLYKLMQTLYLECAEGPSTTDLP